MSQFVTFKQCQCGTPLMEWQGHPRETVALSSRAVWAASQEEAQYGLWPDSPLRGPPAHDVIVQPWAYDSEPQTYPGACRAG
jgi:hypothetical protein